MQNQTDVVRDLLAINRHEPEDEISVAIEAFGCKIGFRVSDAATLGVLVQAFPPAWELAAFEQLDLSFRIIRVKNNDGNRGSSNSRFDYYRDGELLWSGLTLENVTETLESQVQHYIAEFAEPWLFVHAGVVGWNGAAIVLPGASFTGKSTLVAALVAAGATYFSDEYAAINPSAQVLAFRRRLSLRDGPFGPAAKIDLAQCGEGRVSMLNPLPIGLVAFLRYRAGTRMESKTLDTGEGILALCQHTVAIRRRPADALAVLSRVATDVRIIEGVRGEAKEAAAWLLHHATSRA